jgi:hypothetical protein
MSTVDQLDAVANGEFVFTDTLCTRYDTPELQAKKAAALLEALKAKLQEAMTTDERAVIEWNACSKFSRSIIQSFNADATPRPESKKVLNDLDLMRGLNENSGNAERIVIVDDATGDVTYL